MDSATGARSSRRRHLFGFRPSQRAGRA